MNNLEFNKIFASILVALLCMQVFHLIGEGLVKPTYLEKNILGIDGGAQVSSNSKEAEKVLEPISPLLATANVTNGEKTAKNVCSVTPLKRTAHTEQVRIYGALL